MADFGAAPKKRDLSYMVKAFGENTLGENPLVISAYDEKAPKTGRKRLAGGEKYFAKLL
jgi:hypothetical protein